MSVAHAILVLNALLSLAGGLAAASLWPWDWRGRRRTVTLKRDRRPFE